MGVRPAGCCSHHRRRAVVGGCRLSKMTNDRPGAAISMTDASAPAAAVSRVSMIFPAYRRAQRQGEDARRTQRPSGENPTLGAWFGARATLSGHSAWRRHSRNVRAFQYGVRRLVA
jgi:hypothetical protein